MARSNFVGTKLINLKDKLPTPVKAQSQQEMEPTIKTAVEEKVDIVLQPQQESTYATHKAEENKIFPENEEELVTEYALEQNSEIKGKEEKKEKLEKHILKALKERKAEYLRTKEVVLKTTDDTIGQLLRDSRDLESKLEIYQNAITKLQETVSAINVIDESKWDDCDFSLELADAGKLVEHARLESIIYKDKFKVSDDITEKLAAKSALSPSDFYSSTFSQLFNFGLKLFFPLILGVLIAAIIIALSILVGMRAL